MKNRIILAALCSLLCISCEKKPVDPGPDPDPEIPAGPKIAEVTIDESGGILESEDVLLRVPVGSLDTTLTFTLYLEENSTSLYSNQVTRTYSLTGLNGVWSLPIELSIKYDGILDGESYLALAYQYYDKESGDSILVNELYEAVDSLGYLKCSIPPLEMEDQSVKSGAEHPVKYHPLVFHTRLVLRGMSSMGTLSSECAEIKYDRGLPSTPLKVEQLASYIDEAAYFFHSMGIMHLDYFTGKHKLRLQILEDPRMGRASFFIQQDLEEVLDALSIERKFAPHILLQTYQVKIQGSYFEEMADRDLKAFAAKGVLRFNNNCYFGDKENWLLYAIEDWVKAYFYGSYPESLQQSMHMHPFHGMNVLNMEKYIEVFPSLNPLKMNFQHGKGMSPLIKYLMETQNSDLDLMKKLYQAMQEKGSFTQPIDAILSTVGVPENIWWPGFIRAYLSGEVRDIPAEMFMEEIDPEDALHFYDDNDTVAYFDRQYPDLSARLCKVYLEPSLSESYLNDEDKLQFRIGPESLNMDYVKVQVFDYKDGKLEFLGEGKEVMLDRIKSKMEQGTTTLLAVVVNSASESPYKEEMGIDLTVRILKKKSWPWQYLAFKAVVTDAYFRSGTDDYSWTVYEYKLADRVMNVSEDGTRFTASWLDKTDDYKYEGGMDAVMDLETYCITSFYMWSNSESYSGGAVTIAEKTEIRSKLNLSIPVVYWDDVFCNQQITGQDVCEAIESYTYTHTYYPGTQDELKMTLESYQCGEGAELLFFWANRPIGLKGAE
jgi:hypothetical protein